MPKYPDRQRKWRLILLSMTLVTLGFALLASVPAIGPFYGTFVGAIVGLNAVYGGANVANKFVTGKQNDGTEDTPPTGPAST